MNSMIGKSTGIALLMAAALLAALFAMGVFSATGVGADPGHGGADDHTHDQLEAGANISIVPVTIADDGTEEDQPAQTITVVADDFTYDHAVARNVVALKFTVTAGTGTGVPATAWGDESTFEITADAGTTVVSGVALTDAADGTAAMGTGRVNLNDGIVKTITLTVDNVKTDNEASAGVYDITLTYGYPANGSERTPGAAVAIDLNTASTPATLFDSVDILSPDLPSLTRGQDLVVKLPKFGVPSSIDASDITVNAARKPSSVNVDGTTITLTMGDTGDDDTTFPATDTDVTRVRITRAAGVTNPDLSNEAPDSYEVSVEGAAGNKHVGYGVVFREVTVSPGSGARGSEITITGKGFGDGTATISLGSAGYTEKAVSTDGAFTHVVATDIKNNDDDSVFAAGSNAIDVSDSAGKNANTAASFKINSSFSISPANPVPGAPFTITLKDATLMPATGTPPVIPHPTVRVGSNMAMPAGTDGADVDADDDNNNTWKYITPAGSAGSLRVRVSGLASANIDQTVEFGSNPLTVSVDTAVPGQSIDITGSGFGSGEKVDGSDGSSVTIGSKPVATANIESETVDANGNVSLTVAVPDDVSPGSRSVVVIDASGRRGTASITVPKPAITIDPAESRRGEAVTVTGTGFPAGDVISITYNSRALADGNPGTNDVGGFVHTILVPTIASLGEGKTYKINASALINEDAPAATAVDHKILDATVSVSPETATSGQSVDVTGMNFRGLASVTEITIAGQRVTPAGNNNADRDGTFTVTGVVVPLLNPNRYVVKVTAGGEEAIGYITVSDAVEEVSTDPADVFADLIEAGRLERVWYLIGATQMWEFYDPDPELASFNNLDEITVGEAYIVIVSEGDPIEFQGAQLYAGSNNRPIR